MDSGSGRCMEERRQNCDNQSATNLKDATTAVLLILTFSRGVERTLRQIEHLL